MSRSRRLDDRADALGDVDATRILHLHREGTSVVIDLRTDYGPAIIHWGAELPQDEASSLADLATVLQPQRVTGGQDSPPRLAIVPTASSGWAGSPGVEGFRSGGEHFSLLFTLTGTEVAAHRAVLTLEDAETRIRLTVELEIGSGGVFTQRLTLLNTGDDVYHLQALQATFPVPWDSTEILDTTGRHLRERTPQRRAFTMGTHLRESRRGRPGADATLLLACGRPGFGFEAGLVHGVHVGWSGNHRTAAERVTTGDALLTGGELYLPGEINLAPGESVSSPIVYGSWGDGLDALASRFHSLWRARPNHPSRPRPITLNTWEAVYFDHRLDRLTALADAAAEVGVERFVLDDGWYRGRRDDLAGLGDWYVDETVWPDGLSPLIDHVRALGMEFGLWVEAEMVNPDSDLARAHPHWLLQARSHLPASGRNQQLINLANPEAFAYIFERLDALLSTYPIAYLKWDHNRDLVDAGSGSGGHAQVHAHTLAFYRLLDELRAAHPGLEIESCASGGSRVDLGVLDRTDRIWVSDNLDPIERLRNQRYTSLVVPPEMQGTHLTSPTVHTTGRTVELSFTAAVALIGHVGIEWDLGTTEPEQRAEIRRWIEIAKQLRPLVASGRLVNGDTAEPAVDVRGVISAHGTEAVYIVSQVEMSTSYPTARVRLPGLEPRKVFRVEQLGEGDVVGSGLSSLEWLTAPRLLSGAELSSIGLRPLTMLPQRSLVLRVTEEATPER
ncbi:alpha-galactosidase [Plantibacter sp. M259]|uniref:alpha-galactosidase n=1 Tax=Plantibacter sp. M259 TaxID=2583822 RepID=UPI0011104381|nr:alpha-galactosidase [Plantibacter sp. M259]